VYVAEVKIHYMSHDGNLHTRATDITQATPRDTSVYGFEPHQRYRTTARHRSVQSVADEGCDGVSALIIIWGNDPRVESAASQGAAKRSWMGGCLRISR
jgi:hypothetical protein